MAGSITTTKDAMGMKDRALDEFERWAATYDRSLLRHFLFRPAYRVTMEEIAEWHAEHPDPFRVLDIGCGTGELALLLARSGLPVEVIGLDYAPAMTQQANTKAQESGLGQKVKFLTGDSEFLPFAESSFDFVACANSFHHYPNQARVVSLVHKLLRPGGRFLLIDGFRDKFLGFIVFDVIIPAVEGKVYHAPASVIDGYFRDAGFARIRRRRFNFWMPLLATMGEKL